jgi:hypothetical protein
MMGWSAPADFDLGSGVGWHKNLRQRPAPADFVGATLNAQLWQRDEGRFIRDLNLPASSEKYLQRLEAGSMAGLAALAEDVEAGTVAIDGDELRLPRRKPEPKDPRIEPARQGFARTLGNVQFPDVLIEIDVLTRFSWISGITTGPPSSAPPPAEPGY